MPLSQGLAAEFDHECANTRRTLERVPEDKLDWRPHPKSNTMGWLATHLAHIPHWTARIVENTEIDLAGTGAPPANVTSRKELLDMFDQNVAAARAALAKANDEGLMQPWSLRMGEKVFFTLPRVAVMRSFVLSHSIHHRAQLGVYLRLNDVPVPAIYGPSADENPFG